MDSLILMVQAIIIGIVEGVTEFLPISSTGHMIVVGSLINFKGAYADFFEEFIQFGAILAVVVLYRKRIWHSLTHLRPRQSGFRLWSAVIVALIPTGLVALVYKHFKMDQKLFHPVVVALAMLVGGVLLIVLENIYGRKKVSMRAEDVTCKQGFMVGVFQCLSMWPGFSRSASTIMGGWVAGLTTFAAADFTFFLAIPTMFGVSSVTLYSEMKAGVHFSGSQVAALIIGFVVAFIVALVVVKKFIDYLKHKPLRNFAVYRLVVGTLVLILALAQVIK